MPRAFLVKKKKQRVESIAEELAKLENQESRSGGSSDEACGDDSGTAPLVIAEAPTQSDDGNNKRNDRIRDEERMRKLEEIIESRLKPTLSRACVTGDTATSGSDKKEHSLEKSSVDASKKVHSTTDGKNTALGQTKSRPPPLLKVSPGSAFEKVISPHFFQKAPTTLAPPPPLEPCDGHSQLFYRGKVSPSSPKKVSPTYEQSMPPFVMTPIPIPALYRNASQEALNLSRRPSRTDSESSDVSRDCKSKSTSPEYITKKKYILERNGRPYDVPSVELINGGKYMQPPVLTSHSPTEISPVFAPSRSHAFPYPGFYIDRARPEPFMFTRHNPMMQNGYVSFGLRRGSFIERDPIHHHPTQEIPLNLHQNTKTEAKQEPDFPREAMHHKYEMNDINSNDTSTVSQYADMPVTGDSKVRIDGEDPEKLQPKNIKVNGIALDQLIAMQNTVPAKRNGKTVARPPIMGVEYTQNGTDMRLRDMMEKDEAKITRGESWTEEGDERDSSHGDSEEMSTCDEGSITSTSVVADDHGEDDKTSPQNRKYVCDVCGKGFSRSNTLVTHKRIHTGDKPFKCEDCGRAFRQPGNLTRHRLTHTSVKPYVCSQCGKAFNRASNLHTHMRTHTNYKPFVCQYCGKGFHQKIDMKIHSYTHTGEKPHKCKKCGRGFKQLTHLTYHMRTHSDVKMYTCSYCGKGFNQKGNLQAHIYGHTGERPYKCEICGKGFTLASTLNTHRRTHADKKPFICKYCGKDFYQKNALKSHLIASHPYTGESLL
ncbi:uncharacterized protein LOC100373325 [Saccoglossus kowalevskii]|uniref:Myoneurin-like isoform X1 n=1 Tax=Saccoglossus kowalevskii TaxID=10224 RepID=A0ABM0GS85_SACKO|nr:PREDICTED: myoneurin-like isoform X1 [Saccoglossus kowalevskii]XP_006818348.1 PREDICTED: myoneurin-like isoform X2 [Saccoglossus kowalevskii]